MAKKYDYISADEFIIFNDNDQDLAPIKYKLPDPPPFEKTLGFGLDPKDQKWMRFEMSQKLKDLNHDEDLTPKQKEALLSENQLYYKDEILYILRDIDCSANGLWLFIKGKQYFITPVFFFWLQHWKIDGRPVEFRIRDWESWLFDYMVDHDENIIGTNYPKHRREGCTNRRRCKAYYVATNKPYAHCGMQSKDEPHAREIHEAMLLPVWREHIPFWHKPIYNGQYNDTSTLRFSTPLAMKNPDHGKSALNSIISFRDSGEKSYDGLKLHDLFVDEIGKTVRVDVKRRWDIQRQCLLEGSTIIGKAFNGSTVDEMEKGGGQNFKNICDQSHYHKRDPFTKRTTSFLVNFFIPASEGLDGEIPAHLQEKYGCKRWIDEYGFDVIDSQTQRPAAEAYHLAIRRTYELAGDIAGLIEYMRQFPLRWRDCWKTSARECNFNLAILDARIEELLDSNPHVQRGFFEWKNNQQDTEVLWVPDVEGKFNISYQFSDPRDANRYYMENGMRVPGNTRRFSAGGDPYKFSATKGNTRSDGAGAVFMKHNLTLDPPGKDLSEYMTNRFCCTYSARPKDRKVYGEDMIMMCHYFGCQMFPEINVEFLWTHFESRGYGRYLFYSYDEVKKRFNIQPGASTGTKVQEKIYREYEYYIQHFGANEPHLEILQQCKDIETDMQPYDLFVAGGYALMAVENDKFVAEEQTEEDTKELFQTFYYN